MSQEENKLAFNHVKSSPSAQGYNTFEEEESQATATDDTYTIQEAIDALGFGCFQIRISALAVLCMLADSMEMMMMSIIGPILKCPFFLNQAQVAALSTAVFLGMTVTSGVWGIMCDKLGRRTALLLCSSLTGYFGLLSSMSPTYIWILVNRFLMGCGLGGTPLAMTYCSEFLPRKSRGITLLAIGVLWGLGSCLEVALALLVLPVLGWRWLLPMSAVPLLAFYLPESPHYYVAHGQHDKAVNVLKSVARSNGKVLPAGSLWVPLVKGTDKGKLKDLFVPAYRRTTIMLTIMWLCYTTSYYGAGMLTTALFEYADGCHGYTENRIKHEPTCQVSCKTLSRSDYIDLLITAGGDTLGILLCMCLISKCGRKTVLSLLMIIYTVVMACCNICVPRYALVALLFVARAVINGAFDGGMVYTNEVYPTSVRATGFGWCSGVARIGLLVTPFIAQVLVQQSAYLSISIYASLGLIGAISAILLPIETANREMQTTTSEANG